MRNQAAVLKGIVHGHTIELEEPPGIPDGQEVSVTIEPIKPGSLSREAPIVSEARRLWQEAWEEVKNLPPGESLRRAAGAWSDDADELDRFIEWIYEQRKVGRPPLEP